MKSKSFTFAALRIISIWILVEYVIVNIFTGTLNFFQYFSYPRDSFNMLAFYYAKPFYLAIFCSVISWFLWFKADVLSNILITTETNENNIESFSPEKFLSVALIILGFYFIFDSAPDLVQNIVSAVSFNSLTTDLNKKTYLINIIRPALTLLIGIFCILKADRLKSLVKRWL
jgi:hypothetical protein